MSPSAVQSNLSPCLTFPPRLCVSLSPPLLLSTLKPKSGHFPNEPASPFGPPPPFPLSLSHPRGGSLSRCCPPFWVSRLLAKGGQRARGTPVRPSINLGRARATLSIPRN